MKKLFSTSFLAFFILVFSISCSKSPKFGAENVVAEKAMVATAHPIASQVGIKILNNGGNAVDAALAIAFALSIAEPNASGLGGGGFMVIKMANEKNAIMVDYREMAPQKVSPEIYYQSDSNFTKLTESGPLSIGIPGLIAGADLILRKYGTKTLSEVLAPTIKLCNEGIAVSEKLSGMIVDNLEKIMTYPASSEIYFEEMLPLQPGSVLKNPDLANSLKKIANMGPAVFYEGEIAEAIVKEVQNWGGNMQMDDLKSYKAKLRSPVVGDYRGYEIITSAPPSGGGTHLLQLLNIMEGYDVKKMGHNSVEFIHHFAEAMKIIYADKSVNAGDPDFYKVPVNKMIDKNYAAELRKKIDKNNPKYNYAPPHLIEKGSISTSHLSVVDEQGNIVALTQSINFFFGSGIVASGTGILLNNHLNDFSEFPDMANSIEPHKRPVSNTAPCIILKDGKPFMTLGSPGGTRIISALAQIIINVIDFGMSIDESIEAPRVHCLKKILHVEGRIQPTVIATLQEMGHEVKIYEEFDKYFGGAQGILIDLKSGKLYGGADSRRDGVAKGY